MPSTIIRIENTILGPTALTGNAMNVLHVAFNGSNPALTADAQAIVDKVRDFYTSLVSFYTNATTISVGRRVVQFDPLTPKLGYILPTTIRSVTGTGGASAAPPQVAGVVTWRSPQTGKSGRGRTYLGPFASGALDSGGRWTAAQVTTVTTAATTLIAALPPLSGSPVLCVYSPLHQQAIGITSASVDNILDTQRRRA